MRVYTPNEASRHTGSKYLGVLVAAKYARSLNEFRRGQVQDEEPEQAIKREKLTTIALGSVAAGEVEFRLAERSRPGF